MKRFNDQFPRVRPRENSIRSLPRSSLTFHGCVRLHDSARSFYSQPCTADGQSFINNGNSASVNAARDGETRSDLFTRLARLTRAITLFPAAIIAQIIKALRQSRKTLNLRSSYVSGVLSGLNGRELKSCRRNLLTVYVIEFPGMFVPVL